MEISDSISLNLSVLDYIWALLGAVLSQEIAPVVIVAALVVGFLLAGVLNQVCDKIVTVLTIDDAS